MKWVCLDGLTRSRGLIGTHSNRKAIIIVVGCSLACSIVLFSLLWMYAYVYVQ